MSIEAGIPLSPTQQFGTLLWRLIHGRQWDRALETARDWLSQEPENPDAHLGAGQALVNLGKYPQAEVHIAKVLASRPNHGFALRLASIAAFNQQKPARADEYIQRAIELQPNDAMHWYHLALMRYRQGLLEAAEKHARRSLELQPDNADTINLLAICQRGNPQGQLSQYLRALEINPESSVVHTNLGAYHLNRERNYAAAEASFRRALQCDPSNEMAQRNLFLVLRFRDPVYRILTLPRTLLGRISWARGNLTVVARVLLVLLWFSLGRIFWMVFAGWLLLIWPLVKAYEYLTLSDIRAKAGIVGARRGGWQGLHQWPLGVRLGIFAAVVLCFWGWIFFLYKTNIIPLDYVLAKGVVAVCLVFCSKLPGWWRRSRNLSAAKRGEKMFRRRSAKPAPAPPEPY